MALAIPLPSDTPDNDIEQYVPLLLSAVEGFLQLKDVWSEEDYIDGFQLMEALKLWLVENVPMTGKTPVGMIAAWGGNNSTPPAKWLYCDGATVSRSTYSLLFAAIGTTFGVGNGTTTFTLPMLYNRFLLGGLPGAAVPLAQTGGAFSHTLTVAELPAHHHAQNGFATGATSPVKQLAGNRTGSQTTTQDTGDTGSGNAHDITNPYLVVAQMIYAGQ